MRSIRQVDGQEAEMTAQVNLERLKRSAKAMRKATGKTHTECLEQLAKEAGYANYAALVAATLEKS